MLEVAYLSLVPRSWRQTIQSYPSNTRGAEWRLLDATCELDSRSELKLRTGKSLHDYQPFSFTVLKGSLSDEDRRKSNLLGNAIGGLWFIEEQSYLHGWMHFGSENFDALWSQVLAGIPGTWTISLTLEPVENETWKSGSVSVTAASVHFDVTAQPNGPDATARRSWWQRW
jgi:hypothetical protein